VSADPANVRGQRTSDTRGERPSLACPSDGPSPPRSSRRQNARRGGSDQRMVTPVRVTDGSGRAEGYDGRDPPAAVPNV